MEKESMPAEQKPADQNPSPNDDKKSGEVVSETKHSNNKVLMIVLIVIGAFVVLGVIGSLLLARVFKDTATKTLEDVTGTSMTTDGDTTTIKSNDGSVTASTEQKLPEGFPSSIPLYQDQTITDSYKQKNANLNYWQVGATTKDSVTTTVKNLRDKYSKWELVSESENDGSFSLTYKDTKYSVILTVNDNNGTTSLMYAVTEEMMTE